MRIPLTFLLLFTASVRAALPEPDIVFYGRVLHLGGGEPHLVTSGNLQWRVEPFAPSQYTPFEAETQLAALNHGTMSYFIRIPNHLVVPETVTGVEPGLAIPDAEGVPFRNTTITVNGQSVSLADPEGFSFNVSSEERAAYRRLDLILSGSLPDADGDGLPDWWEEKYGTNKHLADASGDLDGDGLTNLAEYRAGTDPVQDDSQPRLAQEYLVSMPIGGTAVPLMQAIDGDSEPNELTYTIAGVPSAFKLELLGRQGVINPRVFTQRDVNEGRIIMHHLGGESKTATLAVTLKDENPEHDPVATTLRVTVSDVATLWQGWQMPEEAQPDTFPIVHDARSVSGGANLSSPSSDFSLAQVPDWERGRLFVSSPGADTLSGSGRSDYFVLGDGDRARGGASADRFLMAGAQGEVVLTDFSVTEHDVVDLRGVLIPASGRRLSDYVERRGAALAVDADGDGSGYTDLTIRFENDRLTMGVADLWDAGLLETGLVVPQTTLFLALSGNASEEELSPATISLRRRGPAEESLTVPVLWSGTATMGIDYAMLPNKAVFSVGEKTVNFVIQPLADDIRETPETVQIVVAGGSDWAIGDGHQTTSLAIADLPSRVWIEVAERVAYSEGGSPAQLLIRRSGPMNAPLSVKLAVGGNAIAGIDYARLPASVTFPVAQAVLPLSVTPLAGASVSQQAETVFVSIVSDDAYLLGETVREKVFIVPQPKTVDRWMSAYGVTEEEEAFLQGDSDVDGFSGLIEFAFNLRPQRSDEWKVRGILDEAECPGLEYDRWPSAPEIRYVLQQSENLKQWDDVSETSYREISSDATYDGMERVQVFLREIPEKPYTYLRIDVRKTN